MNCNLRSESDPTRNAFWFDRVVKWKEVEPDNNGSQAWCLSQESVIVRSCLLTCWGILFNVHMGMFTILLNIIFVQRAVLECLCLGW